MKLSEIHPFFYHSRIHQKRLFRHIQNMINTYRFAKHRGTDAKPYRFVCKKHQSLLRRTLGDSDPRLQENKITNLKIASSKIDGVVIRPGEIFSYWKLIGKPTAKKGYIEGMQLSRGEVRTGVGGGICQLANLLFWLALHTPLKVIERHHHSFDPFPDSGRVLPFGSGASAFYNYVDLRFKNPTNQSFLVNVWVTEKHLRGSMYTDKEWPISYHIEERNHQFIAQENKNYRKNEIWRKEIDKKTGNLIRDELLIKNFSEVKYSLTDMEVCMSGF